LSPKSFARHYLRLYRISTQVVDLMEGLEFRRLENGILLQIDHFERRILVRFPWNDDWTDLQILKRNHALELLHCAPMTSIPEFKLLELNRALKLGMRRAE